MSNDSIAVNCIDNMVSLISKVTAVKGRVFHVYSEDELAERIKGLAFPCVGVIYDGLRAAPESGATGKMGLSAELVVSVLWLFKQDTKAKDDPKDRMINLLDTSRSLIAKTRSPTNHFWRFQLEAAVEGKNGILAYIQRWATPVQLT